MKDTGWLVVPRPRPAADVQLVCVPNAGGGVATFAGWLYHLPETIELALTQLPGRDGRRSEPCCATVVEAAAGLASAIQREAPRPRVLFGHSFGALIAFEAARMMAGTPHAPLLLAVSGRRAPTLPETRTAISHLAKDSFISEAKLRYGGIPDVVLQEPELLDFLLPILRADFACVEAYRHQPGPALPGALVAYGGVDDPHAPAHELTAWRDQTTGYFKLRQFLGGHFFVQSQRDEVLAGLADDVLAARAATGPRLR
jgi:surfactin synthase thioesterase subunit